MKTHLIKPGTRRLVLGCLALAASATLAAPPTQVDPLLAKALAGMPGKEGLMLKVTYPPGGSDDRRAVRADLHDRRSQHRGIAGISAKDLGR